MALLAQRPASPVVEVYKSATCGCCANWVKHLEAAGFTAHVTELSDDALAEFKTKRQIPRPAQSCHTAIVDGYVLEGHVPAADLQRLLKERPKVAGVAVPGMPIGSPGMEVQGVKPQPFDVVTFDAKGTTAVFASHR
jgi:hypothetical protein